MYKPLSVADAKRLASATPTLAAQYSLTEVNAGVLKGWLNGNASATIPGWVTTVVGIGVPEAWMGLGFDALIQVLNGNGDAGRIKAANIAGTVSAGGLVAVTEQVVKDSKGDQEFVWVYIYQATLNGRKLTMPLSVCSAKVKVQ
jgi:hypothetical protein